MNISILISKGIEIVNFHASELEEARHSAILRIIVPYAKYGAQNTIVCITILRGCLPMGHI